MITQNIEKNSDELRIKQKEQDCLSDSPPRKKMRSSKKQRMNQMKDKMRIILAKVQELQKQKIEDRQQLQKLMGNSEEIQQLTVSKVQKCQEIRASSLTKPIKKSPPISNPMFLSLNEVRSLPKCSSVGSLRADQSYIRTKPLSFKKVKKEKIQLGNQTVKNFSFAVLVGIILILFIKFFSGPSSSL